MLRPSMKLALLAVPFAVGWLLPGCGLQGEGQLCSTLTVVDNVSSDCDQSVRQLTCVAKSGLGLNAGICCPPDGSGAQSSKAECQRDWHLYDYDAGATTTSSASGGTSTSSGSTSSSTTASVSASSSTSTGSTSSGSTGSTSSGAGGGSTSSGSSMTDGGM